MGSSLLKLGLAMVLFGILYQSWLKETLFETIGLGRVIQSIDEFPYTCRRIRHERLEACEDLWLDDQERVLYLACAGSLGRLNWNAAIGNLNASGRRPGGSEVIAVNIDSPQKDGLFEMRGIKPKGYEGATGDGTLDTLGFDVEVIDASTLRFWLINLRPPVDSNKSYLDASKIGANSTIDVFDLKRGKEVMVHVKTVVDPAVWTPNGIAAMGDGSFVTTNDHSAKVGWRRKLDHYIGGGNVAYCPASGPCNGATPSRFFFPNGLVRGTDGLVYVPISAGNGIYVMELQGDGSLRELDFIRIGMPIDNISVDINGDIWVAGLPKALKSIPASSNPFTKTSPASVWCVTKTPEGYKKVKVLEDREMKILNQVSTVQHDVKTGRLFMGGPSVPYLTVCEPK